MLSKVLYNLDNASCIVYILLAAFREKQELFVMTMEISYVKKVNFHVAFI